MDADILIHKPTWSVVMIGMNDVNRGLYATSRQNEAGIEKKRQQVLDLYRKNLEIIIQKLLAANSKVILQRPSIYDQTSTMTAENLFGVNDALKKCAEYSDELAKKYKLMTVDYWSRLSGVNRTLQQMDPTATIIGSDRVHPGPPGHLVMAYEFLKSTGGTKYVSRIIINKNLPTTSQGSANCTISDLSVKKNSITFSCKENSLPFPVIDQASKALTLVPFTDDFNVEQLVIKNKLSGTYKLLIDDINIGTYTGGELQSGINLAVIKNTPQYQQALKIMDLYTDYRKTQASYRNIRAIELYHLPDSLLKASMEKKEKFLDEKVTKYTDQGQKDYNSGQFKNYFINKAQEQNIINKLAAILESVYTINKPELHRFKLVRQSN